MIRTLPRTQLRRSAQTAENAPAGILIAMTRERRHRRASGYAAPMTTDLPLPPAHLRFMESTEAEYYEVGDRMAAELTEFTSLKPTDTILDIGSGYGRVSSALWRRGHRGRYVGMDILERHIQWCTDHMTPATGGLYAFHHLDISNDRYNPSGSLDPTEVSLDLGIRPDVVLLASVFTHMYADGIVHYLNEIGSLLPSNGRVMATFFLINQSQQTAEAAGLSRFPLRFRVDDCSRCWTLEDPLHVIAYYETWVHRQVRAAGLEVKSTHRGSWCGRHNLPMIQDTLILVRTSDRGSG